MAVVRRAAGRKHVGISRTTEHRLLIEDPTFPRPIQLTPGGLTGYIVEELDAWAKARPRVYELATEPEPRQRVYELEPELEPRQRVKSRCSGSPP